MPTAATTSISKTPNTRGEHVVVDPALDQREARDIEDRVPRADDRQARERPQLVRPRRDERERHTPHDEAAGERPRQLSQPDEPDPGEAADEAAGAESRVEEADARVAGPAIERGDDEQHVEDPANECLTPEQDDQTGPGSAANVRAPASMSAIAPCPPAGRCGLGERRETCNAAQSAMTALTASTTYARERQQHPRERRADEHGNALEGARGHVRRDELLRRPGEQRHDGELRRPVGRAGDRCERGEQEDEPPSARCRQDDRRRAKRGRTDQLDAEQHPLALRAVGQRGAGEHAELAGSMRTTPSSPTAPAPPTR